MLQCLSQLTRATCRMTPALILSAFLAVPAAITSAAVVKPQEKEKPKDPPPMVIRYEGSQQQKYSGKQVLVVYGVNLLSGKEMQWLVPAADDKAKQYTPKPEIMDVVDQLKAGSYAKVEMHSSYNENWLNRIEFYKMASGEELPGNFVFYETYERKDDDPHAQVVTLQKFGQAVDVVLPMKTDKGQSVIDPDMLTAVNAMKKGDVVSVDVINGPTPVLKSIDPYKPPVNAKIGKVVEAEVADGIKGPAVQLDEDGTAVTLPLKGQASGKKWVVADPVLLNRVKNMKPGTAVLVTTHDQDGKTYLRDIKVAPAQPAATSGTGATPSKFNK
jgi:hypothetical protein